jgi:hypothetical protein
MLKRFYPVIRIRDNHRLPNEFKDRLEVMTTLLVVNNDKNSGRLRHRTISLAPGHGSFHDVFVV